MEKLLSTAKKEGGKYAGPVTGQRKKNISYSFGSNRKCFLPTHGKQPKRQPISGCIILDNQEQD